MTGEADQRKAHPNDIGCKPGRPPLVRKILRRCPLEQKQRDYIQNGRNREPNQLDCLECLHARTLSPARTVVRGRGGTHTSMANYSAGSLLFVGIDNRVELWLEGLEVLRPAEQDKRGGIGVPEGVDRVADLDRKSTRLNSSHLGIS